MKKQVVDCETGLIEVVDMTDAEIDQQNEKNAQADLKSLEPKPPTLEERLAALEAALEAK